MKKIALFAVASALALSATSAAFAGGYAAPVVEPEPVAVEETGSSGSMGLAPLLGGLAVVALIAASDDSSSSSTTAP